MLDLGWEGHSTGGRGNDVEKREKIGEMLVTDVMFWPWIAPVDAQGRMLTPR